MKSNIGYPLLALVAVVVVFALVQVSHPDVRQRNYQFPGGSEMSHSPAYSALEPNQLMPDGATRQRPVPGVVATDEMPFPFGPQREGYVDPQTEMQLAGEHVAMPEAFRPPTSEVIASEAGDAAVARDQQIVARGRELFTTYCAVCHGAAGNGDGRLASYVEFSSVAFPLSTRIRDLNDGELFYLITRGGRGGVMASYAVQTTRAERWQLVRFLRTLVDTEPTDSGSNPPE